MSPTPVQPVTYEWRTTALGAVTQTSTSLPNATTVIQSSHAKYGHYYCIVKQYGATLGTGVIRIEVESEPHIISVNMFMNNIMNNY